MWEILLWASMGSGVTSFGIVCVNIARSRRELGSKQAVMPHNRVPTVGHHLDAPDLAIDEHGYRLDMDWQFVAILEDELGYTHTDEADCRRGGECWAENQSPTYVVENGFLAIESFPQLPEPSPLLKKDSSGRRVDSPRESSRFHNELAALKARGYAAQSQTINELRAMPEHVEVAKLTEEENYKRILNKIDEQLTMAIHIPPNNMGGVLQEHEELEWLESYVKERLQSGNTIVLPEGYHVTYRQGGELAQINSPTGMSLIVDVDAYRPRPSIDRRRDAFRTSLDGVGRGVDKRDHYNQA